MSTLPLVFLLITVAVGAFAQRTTGIGFTLLVGPACSVALHPDATLGTAVRLAIVADVAVLVAQRSGLVWREVSTYLWPALAAFPLALVTARALPADALLVAAACATIAAALLLSAAGSPRARQLGPRIARATPAPRAPQPVLAAALARSSVATVDVSPTHTVAAAPSAIGTRIAGFAAGFLGVTTGMAGPPLALHATLSQRPLAASRPTMTAFFLVIDAAAIAAHPNAASGGITALLVVALLAGATIGGLAVTRIRDAHLRRAIPPFVLAGACTALVRVLG